MLPQRRQLEGPDLEGLLEQVKAEYGDSARIVQAEKVRTGGLAGFFARERFHIDVEIDGSNGAADRTSDAATDVVAVPSPLPDAAPRTLLELVDRVSEQERAAAGPPARERVARVSTESPSFEAVLAALRREEVADPTAEPPADPTAEPPVEAVAGAAERPGAAVTAPVTGPPTAAPRAALALVREPDLGLPAPVLAAAAEQPDDPYAVLLGWLRTVPTVPPPAYARGQIIAVAGELPAALRVAGVLAEELAADPGAVVVAVPSGDPVRGVPARRRVTDPAELAKRRVRWARRPDSTIVVVSAPLALRPAGWAAAALAAVAPTFTWGVAQATTKPDDVSAWSRRIGGVDALAVDNVEATGDPAAVLRGPIPVGMVDGRRSSPGLWAALLADRLAGVR